MNDKGKKKLTSLIGRMSKIISELTVLTENEKKLLTNRDAEVDEGAEPKEITEADIECLTDVTMGLQEQSQNLTDHFALE